MLNRLVLTLMIPALLAAPLASVKPASASVAISISYFHDSLEPYGSWIDYSSYGRCWVPHVSAGWRPYSNGHWAYTDFGWTWVAYEPWGWAPFHYGRWVFDPFYGWVWVPGTVWAPAWVAWRHYDSWVGWAPLPPVSGWQTSFVYSYSSVVVERIPAERWCFVSTTHLLDRDIDRRLVSVRRNAGLI